MRKILTFFKQFLGLKTNDSPISEPNKQLKRRWSFGKSRKGLHDLNKHTIVLAAATAAVVDAAVAAAQAATEVVRMTGGTIGYGVRDELAAIKIQSHFRAYLARKALRALKALVRLQALVRGHILRKQTADMMRRLQALIRAQERACAVRSQINGSTTKHSHFHHHGPPTPQKIEHFPHNRSILKRNGSKSHIRGIACQERIFLDGLNDHKNNKIVEVDTAKSHVTTKGRKLFQPDHISLQHSHSLTTSRESTLQPTSSSPCASCEVNSFYYSTRGVVSTPAKSECSRSCCLSSFSDHPNYMAYTESSRAKVRSLSAPRLRPQLEVSNATRRDSGYKYVMGMQRGPTKRDSFVKKTYPGSARLDQLRLPVYDMEDNEYCDGYWN